MKINEQELADAIEVITEGGSSLGVSCEDVYRKMMRSEDFMLSMCYGIHAGSDVSVCFMSAFDYTARKMILAAHRAELESEINNAMD